ncbi:unnamed protein product [Oncorhynchus mykiss]|uniref:Uncharacterized protein n=1 Tax=Oncorhynchus mykiss TaxID=8022 RepID=A0A060Z4A4_ONCMY|nr:unnamed protein product [Oncorhynchus mykiss]
MHYNRSPEQSCAELIWVKIIKLDVYWTPEDSTLKHLFQKLSSMEKNIELLSCSQIWVCSGHNASGYFTVYGDEALQSDHFNSRLSFGDTQTIWARTGYLGFLRRTELTDASGERHDALYVVGALDEAMELRGMRYHPIDIETSVIRTHKSITEW